MNTIQTEQLDQLCAQVELAWADSRDRQTVDILASQHPDFSTELYDFFALLIETELMQAPVVAKQPVLERVRSFLSQLCEHTGAKATEIAAKLSVPYPLLVMMQRHPQSVPNRVREELATRAANLLQFDRLRALAALAQPYAEPMAASRDKAYQAEELSFADLLKRAKVSKAEQKYWLSLADES
ncbi:MAG: hypothetical protein HOP19_05515 [Acidobacteria bacterium]|nr:hypothetical protein [Acidobacteriota bacterium]